MAILKIFFISAFLFCFIVQDIASNPLVSDKTAKLINNNASVEKIAFYSGRSGNNEIYVGLDRCYLQTLKKDIKGQRKI